MASNVVNRTLKTRSRVLSLYRQIFRLARVWNAQSGVKEDSIRESEYMKEEARTLFRQNAHLTDEEEIENHIKEAELRIELTLHYGTPYPRLINIPPNTLAAHIAKSSSSSSSDKAQMSRRTERALRSSIPSYLKSYTYKPVKKKE
uniref:Complex 1 LYR protein domain-containing protein n=1 Tax=Trichobilharzia regenti TaxID=157069 RepID=A0AA85IPB1_TRIRE|nr:unnamed protein product [Trichobilharzia regenti]